MAGILDQAASFLRNNERSDNIEGEVEEGDMVGAAAVTGAVIAAENSSSITRVISGTATKIAGATAGRMIPGVASVMAAYSAGVAVYEEISEGDYLGAAQEAAMGTVDVAAGAFGAAGFFVADGIRTAAIGAGADLDDSAINLAVAEAGNLFAEAGVTSDNTQINASDIPESQNVQTAEGHQINDKGPHIS